MCCCGPKMTDEEWQFRNSKEGQRRQKVYDQYHKNPETWPEAEIDDKGLIWSDGKVLINCFQSAHITRQTDKLIGPPDRFLR